MGKGGVSSFSLFIKIFKYSHASSKSFNTKFKTDSITLVCSGNFSSNLSIFFSKLERESILLSLSEFLSVFLSVFLSIFLSILLSLSFFFFIRHLNYFREIRKYLMKTYIVIKYFIYKKI